MSRTSNFGVALYGNDRWIADDFAGIDAPKLKFNFTLALTLTDMIALPQKESLGNEDPKEIAFGIKQISRPNPTVVYEDVNYYNFMTKVATKVEFGVVTITLYDDVNNRAHDIFEYYMRAISPIVRYSAESATDLHNHGMADSSGQTPTSSSLGPLTDNAINGPIKSLRVTHITTAGTVVYDYLNPKIQTVSLDELDMSQSDVNIITFTFVYDSYNVTTFKKSMDSGNSTSDANRFSNIA